jgi:hypothetical protein
MYYNNRMYHTRGTKEITGAVLGYPSIAVLFSLVPPLKSGSSANFRFSLGQANIEGRRQ